VRWHQGGTRTCGGFTRDVSTNGAFVLCSEELPVGETVQIEILLPTSGQVPGTALKSTGRVVRRYGESEAAGFAIQGRLGQAEFPDASARPALQ
jgi:hypothetical protein